MIVAAAIMLEGLVYTLPAPARHADIERTTPVGSFWFLRGFVDDEGLFMDRKEAMKHARECGQLVARNQPNDPIGAKPRITGRPDLYTEDLW